MTALELILSEMQYDTTVREGKASPSHLRRLAHSFREDPNTLRPIFEFVCELGLSILNQLQNLSHAADLEPSSRQFVDQKLTLLSGVFKLHLGCLKFAPSPLLCQSSLYPALPILVTNRFLTPTQSPNNSKQRYTRPELQLNVKDCMAPRREYEDGMSLDDEVQAPLPTLVPGQMSRAPGRSSTLTNAVHNAMSGLLRLPTSSRPTRPSSGFAAFLDRPEVTIIVIFESVFYALERPGWQPALIEIGLKCLKEYAQFKSQNFGTVTSKNKFVQTFLQQLLKLMSLFDPASGQPDSIGGSQHRPLKLSTETLRYILQIIGAFF